MDFLQDIALVSDQDTLANTTDAPTLLTFHTAKGLEFPIVFIVGLEDGTLPHIRSKEDPEAMAETVVCFYVGITRAKNQLYPISAMNRATYGYSEPTDPSPFLDDIPHGTSSTGVAQPAKNARTSAPPPAEPTTWEKFQQTRTGAPAVPVRPRYSAGMRVRHGPGGGHGAQQSVTGWGRNRGYLLEKVGLKRVAASLANLVVVAK